MVYQFEMNLPELIAIMLATYYMVVVMLREQGPFHIFWRLKLAAGMQVGVYDYDNDAGEYVWREIDRAIECIPDEGASWKPSGRFFSKVMSCQYCLSPYVAIIMFLAWAVFPPIVYILAAAGLTVAILEI